MKKQLIIKCPTCNSPIVLKKLDPEKTASTFNNFIGMIIEPHYEGRCKNNKCKNYNRSLTTTYHD